MKLFAKTVAEAIGVTFNVNTSDPEVISGAGRVLAMLDRGDSRAALIQTLRDIQHRTSETVTHEDCAWLADKLLEVRANA